MKFKKNKLLYRVVTVILCICMVNPQQIYAYNADEQSNILAKATTSARFSTASKEKNNNVSNKQTTRILDLRVMLGLTYRAEYSNPESEIEATFLLADYPFIEEFSLEFDESYVNISPLPIDYCTLGRTNACTDASCGSGCNNEITNYIHHKNAIKNLNKVKNDIPNSGYDIFVTVVATPLCGVWGTLHDSGILGVTFQNDNYTLLTNSSNISTNVRVRIMQHEICHMFNCYDGSCVQDTPCIMNGGYDGVSLYTSYIFIR